ncbi:UNVERIFIED_CONTAM: hypothetical protein FKN15_051637 [Acipenser sinensis]
MEIEIRTASKDLKVQLGMLALIPYQRWPGIVPLLSVPTNAWAGGSTLECQVDGIEALSYVLVQPLVQPLSFMEKEAKSTADNVLGLVISGAYDILVLSSIQTYFEIGGRGRVSWSVWVHRQELGFQHRFQHSLPSKYIPRRAVLYVPGNDERKLRKLASLNVDCAVFDCEDGVALSKKILCAGLSATWCSAHMQQEQLLGSASLRRTKIHLLTTVPASFLDPTRSDPVLVTGPVLTWFWPDNIQYRPGAIYCSSSMAEARTTIPKMLQALNLGRTEKCVRVNSVSSGLAELDLEAVLQSEVLPPALMLPKVENTEEVRWIQCASRTKEAHELLYARQKVVVTAKAFGLQAIDLVYIDYQDEEGLRRQSREGALMGFTGASRTKEAHELLYARQKVVVTAKAFGLQAIDLVYIDYQDEEGLRRQSREGALMGFTGASRTKEAHELLYARQKVVVTAKAFGLQAIDLVYIDYQDEEGLRRQSREGALMGFTGKQVIHPNQIKIVQEEYFPRPEKVKWAQVLISAFDEHQKLGKGAFSFHGSMIDMPSLKQAQNIVTLASAIQDK